MKYLFKALFKDGSIIEQTPEDKSLTTEGRNAFYDVLQRMGEVRAFALYGDNNEYLVDLEDGHFEVNQVPINLYNEPVSNLRLVYFIRNTIITNLSEITAHHKAYNFGWQANDAAGNNVQRLITIV